MSDDPLEAEKGCQTDLVAKVFRVEQSRSDAIESSPSFAGEDPVLGESCSRGRVNRVAARAF